VAVDPFGMAEHRFRTLQEERRQGVLDARAFRAAVRGLAVVDGEGRSWVLGPEDVPAEPPRRLVCQRCGQHNLTRHTFCVECGAQLNRAGL